MERMIAIPEALVLDLVDLADRARDRLATLEPRDPLHDALTGAVVAVRHEIHPLATV